MEETTWDELLESYPETAPRVQGYLMREWSEDVYPLLGELGAQPFKEALECEDEKTMFAMCDNIIEENRCKRSNRRRYFARTIL